MLPAGPAGPGGAKGQFVERDRRGHAEKISASFPRWRPSTNSRPTWARSRARCWATPAEWIPRCSPSSAPASSGPSRFLAVIGRSASYPEVQWRTAVELAARFKVPLLEVDTHELADPAYTANPLNRCFFCKSELWRVLGAVAAERGFDVLLDGTNADDLREHRPGAAAGAARRVHSPFVELGWSKADVREAARQLGLPTWDAPAAPCLSSRIQYGLSVTPERLRQVELAEAIVRAVWSRRRRAGPPPRRPGQRGGAPGGTTAGRGALDHGVRRTPRPRLPGGRPRRARVPPGKPASDRLRSGRQPECEVACALPGRILGLLLLAALLYLGWMEPGTDRRVLAPADRPAPPPTPSARPAGRAMHPS